MSSADETAEAAFIADVLRARATVLFDKAIRAEVDDPVHGEYLEAQGDYEDYMRSFGNEIEQRLRSQAAEQTGLVDSNDDKQRQAAADRGWNRFLDWRAVHREELRVQQGRSR